jgi:hypothetical protein
MNVAYFAPAREQGEALNGAYSCWLEEGGHE